MILSLDSRPHRPRSWRSRGPAPPGFQPFFGRYGVLLTQLDDLDVGKAQSTGIMPHEQLVGAVGRHRTSIGWPFKPRFSKPAPYSGQRWFSAGSGASAWRKSVSLSFMGSSSVKQITLRSSRLCGEGSGSSPQRREAQRAEWSEKADQAFEHWRMRWYVCFRRAVRAYQLVSSRQIGRPAGSGPVDRAGPGRPSVYRRHCVHGALADTLSPTCSDSPARPLVA